MNPVKMQAISRLRLPKAVKDLGSFLDMLNHYRRFWAKAAHHQLIHSAYLSRLKIENSRSIAWSPRAILAFEDIKQVLMEATVPAFRQQDASPAVLFDASDMPVLTCTKRGTKSGSR